MSIKDELQRKLDSNEQRNAELRAKSKAETEAKQKLEREARNMIDEFIIPKFREIASRSPKTTYLYIRFHYRTAFRYRKVITYKSNIDDWNAPKSKPLFMSDYDWRVFDHASWHDSPYSEEVVSAALSLANEYDIHVRTGSSIDEYDEFSLRLE